MMEDMNLSPLGYPKLGRRVKSQANPSGQNVVINRFESGVYNCCTCRHITLRARWLFEARMRARGHLL